jgi:hypothetical protein
MEFLVGRHCTDDSRGTYCLRVDIWNAQGEHTVKLGDSALQWLAEIDLSEWTVAEHDGEEWEVDVWS